MEFVVILMDIIVQRLVELEDRVIGVEDATVVPIGVLEMELVHLEQVEEDLMHRQLTLVQMVYQA
mgnify:CR=1 FL=1